jgi:aminopeptidase N
MKKEIFSVLCFLLVFCSIDSSAQSNTYTHADTLKGSISKQRFWWDLIHYDLNVDFNIPDSSIKGFNTITYRVLESHSVMQLDLMKPMLIDSIFQDDKKCTWKEDGNAHFVTLNVKQNNTALKSITVYFHGKPRTAILPPWDGGVIWSKDKKGNPWVSVACQGMAAQVWFPNKDHMYDEPDSCLIHITCPSSLIAVSNGNLKALKINSNQTATYSWIVKNPINNYNIIPYIGKYINFKDTIQGENGLLDLSYWVLEGNYARARKQFMQSKTMLHAFEYWFGPYPFYQDSYKLVEAPFLGMEHQSGIAYGNDYMNGYRGRDLSQSGWGLKWDFIIVHESGHEWFGNNITAEDVADNWIHESFTAYSENLYTEYLFGKQAGADYVIGTRRAVLNDKPIIADYNVNAGGSNDLYYKGANMLHTIRLLVNNDSLWRQALRALNKEFYHKTVTSNQIENYLIDFLKVDLKTVFDQYLRTKNIPTLEYYIKKNKLHYRWVEVVPGFNMPLKMIESGNSVLIYPTEKWQSQAYTDTTFTIDRNFYVNLKETVKN